MDTLLLTSIPISQLEAIVSRTVEKAFVCQAEIIKEKQNEEKFLSQKEVAEKLNASTVSIWQWEKKGLLKSYRIGNLKRFKESEILQAPKLIIRTKK